MAKGHFQFRPKDGDILTWMRRQAEKDKRSVNSWMEVHFQRLMEEDQKEQEEKEQRQKRA